MRSVDILCWVSIILANNWLECAFNFSIDFHSGGVLCCLGGLDVILDLLHVSFSHGNGW